ncbi:hypothetical protein WS71_24400 [Burkholderia mayonis]|uniref:Uncharacterized protein n=2 Tax=Burkholderia mayonis TaxID=1385591 RepID=A0A1B4G346_9BURK|nr:hypothetical protein WS71_24400 [Burkholderia mayonis]KVE53664.1 hypothetical protein WS71_06370 [Burkholderia mayonis]
MACREGWKRPIGWKYFRQNDSWDEILEALQASDHPLEVPEIASITGRTEALIYKRLKERRGKYVHVEAWRTTMSKPAAKWALGGGIDAPKPISGKWSTKPDANPFLVALGAVAAPKNHRGRVIEMLDEPETEEQLA